MKVSIELDVTRANTERGRYALHYALEDCPDATHVILMTGDTFPPASVVDVIRCHAGRLDLEVRGGRFDLASMWRTALLTWRSTGGECLPDRGRGDVEVDRMAPPRTRIEAAFSRRLA